MNQSTIVNYVITIFLSENEYLILNNIWQEKTVGFIIMNM